MVINKNLKNRKRGWYHNNKLQNLYYEQDCIKTFQGLKDWQDYGAPYM